MLNQDGTGPAVGKRALNRNNGVSECTCPKCGHKEPHKRGTPCSSVTTCPVCGEKMKGDNCL